MIDDTHRDTERIIDLSHPDRIAAREIVVDGDHVHALAGQRIEVRRERGDERLAFARAHFRDIALMQDHAADQLHIEVALPERSTRCFAHGRECLRSQRVERFTLFNSGLKFKCFCL